MSNKISTITDADNVSSFTATNRRIYQKNYAKKNYKKWREYKKNWMRTDRVKKRHLKIKDIVYHKLLPLLKNLK